MNFLTRWATINLSIGTYLAFVIYMVEGGLPMPHSWRYFAWRMHNSLPHCKASYPPFAATLNDLSRGPCWVPLSKFHTVVFVLLISAGTLSGSLLCEFLSQCLFVLWCRHLSAFAPPASSNWSGQNTFFIVLGNANVSELWTLYFFHLILYWHTNYVCEAVFSALWTYVCSK